MAGQACAWAGVGAANAPLNQSRTRGLKEARGSTPSSLRAGQRVDGAGRPAREGPSAAAAGAAAATRLSSSHSCQESPSSETQAFDPVSARTPQLYGALDRYSTVRRANALLETAPNAL